MYSWWHFLIPVLEVATLPFLREISALLVATVSGRLVRVMHLPGRYHNVVDVAVNSLALFSCSNFNTCTHCSPIEEMPKLPIM